MQIIIEDEQVRVCRLVEKCV